MIKLIATDIDGTLLNYDTTVPDRLQACLNNLKEQGIKEDNIKLLMNKSKEPLIPIEKKIESNILQKEESSNKNIINDPNENIDIEIKSNINIAPSYQKIENVRKIMINKYKENNKAIDLIENLLKTMPHKEEMSEDELLIRVEQFLLACLPKTMDNYYLKLSLNESAELNEMEIK